MRIRTGSAGSAAVGIAVAVALVTPSPASAQLWKKVRDRAKRTAETEALDQVDRMVRGKIRCVFNDVQCIEDARSSGDDYVLTDAEGEILLDEDGMPISDFDEVDEAPEGEVPGLETMVTGGTPGLDEAFTNYDFVPGERVLYYEDYMEDEIGDFPRRMVFRHGNWDVVEWNGSRYLRNTGPRHSAVEIELPESLPTMFTIEFEAFLTHGNHRLVLAPGTPKEGPGPATFQALAGNVFQVGVSHGTGVIPASGGVESKTPSPAVGEGPVAVRIMVDDRYAKVYVDHRRVANVPNAEFSRTRRLYIENIYAASEANPILLGPIRVAAGGRDLYDVLEEEGRAATYGILFAVNSSEIRPESTPTLRELGEMMRDHPDLRLSIEGHTDSDGDDDYNLRLSEERAEAVREHLVGEYGIDVDRLEAVGLGETMPVLSNDTPEGKQQNRRVELVRLS